MLRKFFLTFALAASLSLLPTSALAQTAATASAVVTGLPDFTQLVEKQGAAVVNISTTQKLTANAVSPFGGLPFDQRDPAFEFFRRFFPQMPNQPLEREARSLGSGFIISSDGYILTNAHVVDGATEVTVRLTDKREFKAQVLGADKRTDVALIKIDVQGLPTVKLGNPEQLRVGEWVIAIGSPFGFDNSVTAGIVSAKGRALPQESFVPFIQTDAAINPGNSGGPLFNMRGEVIGINSQIYSRSGGYMGVAFAIPIDVAMEVQNQLKLHGRVNRGRIGVVIRELSKELAESFGLSKPNGALIEAVEPGGPADKAGLLPGDIILRFAGKSIEHSADLQRLVGNTAANTQAEMQVWRQGASKTLKVVVAELVDDQLAAVNGRQRRGGPNAQNGPGAARPAQSTNAYGLMLAPLSVEQKQMLKLEHGLLIEDLRNTRLNVDLRPGDIILALIAKGVQTPAVSVDEFNKRLNQLGRNAVITLRVQRGSAQGFITLKGLNEVVE